MNRVTRLAIVNTGLTGLCFGLAAALFLVSGAGWWQVLAVLLIGVVFMALTWRVFSRGLRQVEVSLPPDGSVKMPFDAIIDGVGVLQPGESATIEVRPGDKLEFLPGGDILVTQARVAKDATVSIGDAASLHDCLEGRIGESIDCKVEQLVDDDGEPEFSIQGQYVPTPEPDPVPHDGECWEGCCGS